MKRNLMANVPDELPKELIEVLVKSEGVRVERIVSRGHSSPADFWYDQADSEWVLVVSGAARLRFEQGDEVVEMRRGDHVDIPAGTRHRVDWTDPDQDTTWLAVFY